VAPRKPYLKGFIAADGKFAPATRTVTY
jgi:hypothetical protein